MLISPGFCGVVSLVLAGVFVVPREHTAFAGLDLIAKIWPETHPVYDLTAIDTRRVNDAPRDLCGASSNGCPYRDRRVLMAQRRQRQLASIRGCLSVAFGRAYFAL